MNNNNLSNTILNLFLSFTLLIFLVLVLAHTVMAESIEIVERDTWRYFKGIKKPPFKWNHIGFDDSSWVIGSSGFGYGDTDLNTVLDDMKGNYLSTYASRNLTIKNPATVKRMVFSIICDGSFKAWLNGIEVIRSHDKRVAPRFGRRPRAEIIDITGFAHELLPGTNVLAVECSNDSINSNSFHFIPALQIR